MSIAAAQGDGERVGLYLDAHHGKRLALCGIDLALQMIRWMLVPGMMELPGSFAGKTNSPNPHLGPEPRSRMIVCNLE